MVAAQPIRKAVKKPIMAVGNLLPSGNRLRICNSKARRNSEPPSQSRGCYPGRVRGITDLPAQRQQKTLSSRGLGFLDLVGLHALFKSALELFLSLPKTSGQFGNLGTTEEDQNHRNDDEELGWFESCHRTNSIGVGGASLEQPGNVVTFGDADRILISHTGRRFV